MSKQTPTKLPIFLACPEPKVIQMINEAATDLSFTKESGEVVKLSEAFEVAIIQPDIARKLNDTFLMMKMDASIREQVLATRKDDAQNTKAKMAAFNIRSVISEQMFGKDSKEKVDTFRAEDLNYAIQIVQKRRLSHKEINELLDFVSMHNFIEPVDINEKRHLRLWKFTFSPQDHIEATEQLQKNVKAQLEALQGQYDQLEQNKLAFVEQIQEVGNAEVEEPAKQEPKKKPAAKKRPPVQKISKPKRTME